MPATYAHYVFGKKVFQKLPEGIKQEICQGKDAFLLGLHGPDLLFYYYPIKKNRINQQGVLLHKELAADFFDRGRTYWRRSEDPKLRAYLYGFLCHFILDNECHPFVNKYVEERGLGHLTIETEFDRYLMALDRREPLNYAPSGQQISHNRTDRSDVRSGHTGADPYLHPAVSAGHRVFCLQKSYKKTSFENSFQSNGAG